MRPAGTIEYQNLIYYMYGNNIYVASPGWERRCVKSNSYKKYCCYCVKTNGRKKQTNKQTNKQIKKNKNKNVNNSTGCNRELASWTYTVPGRVVCARNGNRGWRTRQTGYRRLPHFGRRQTAVTLTIDRSSAADFDRNLFRHRAIRHRHLRHPSAACWKSAASWTEQWSAHL